MSTRLVRTAMLFLDNMASTRFDNGDAIVSQDSLCILYVQGQVVARAYRERNSGKHIYIEFNGDAPCEYINVILEHKGYPVRVLRDEFGLWACLNGKKGLVELPLFNASHLSHCALYDKGTKKEHK